ncbi:MAG: GerMN domain-containing protein [Armatimonadetes bacterium]|nr:GerMN domain-containing protein [Candidatus Hippobium faecium]
MRIKRRLDRYNRKPFITKKQIILVLFAGVLLSVMISVCLNYGHRRGEKQMEGSDSNFKPQIVDNDTSKWTDVPIFVPDEKKENEYSEVKIRVLDNRQKLNSKMNTLLKVLISRELVPKNTSVIGNINVENGVATINFSEEMKNFSGSAGEEAMVLNSIAKTMVNRKDRIEKVKIKVSGKEIESLGGHFELSEPFSAD